MSTEQRYIALRAELLADPLGRGYAAMSHQAAAADLNTAYRTRRKLRAMLDERGVFVVLGPTGGEAAMQGLETVAASGTPFAPVVARAVRWLKQGVGNDFDTSGVDFASDATWAMLDALEAAGALTAEAVGDLKGYGTETYSRAVEVFGFAVTHEDVNAARSLP